jgi:hypothetical protein
VTTGVLDQGLVCRAERVEERPAGVGLDQVVVGLDVEEHRGSDQRRRGDRAAGEPEHRGGDPRLGGEQRQPDPGALGDAPEPDRVGMFGQHGRNLVERADDRDGVPVVGEAGGAGDDAGRGVVLAAAGGEQD